MSEQPKKKRETKIKYRILRLAIISVAVCVVALMIVLSVTTLLSYNKSYISQTKSLTQAYGEVISNTLNSLTLEIESAGNLGEAFDQSIPIEERKETLNQLAATTMFKDFAVAFENGTTYNNTDISEREYFRIAMDQQKVAISAPVIRKTDGSVTTMMAAPANHNGEKYVIYGGINSDLFCNGLDRIDMGEGSNIVVLDKNGQVVAASDKNLVLTMANYLTSENEGEKSLAETMLAGGEGMAKYNNGKNTMIAYYMPVDNTDGWVIAASANFNQILSAVFVDIGIGVGLSLALICLGIFISIKVANNISSPVVNSTERLKLLAEGDVTTPFSVDAPNDETLILETSLNDTVETLRTYINDIRNVLESLAAGDLTVKSELEYKGDFVAIGTALNQISSALNSAMSAVKNSVSNIQAGAGQVSEGSQSLSETAIKEAEAVDKISNTIVAIQQKADTSAKVSENVAALAQEANTKAHDGGELMGELLEAVENIKDKSASIKNIIETIEDIAFQTNILALNAAIEAARAGQAGKGFAVVADEVGNLAAKSAEAAQNTTELINDSLSAVEKGTVLADEAHTAMDSIVVEISKIFDQMNEITAAAAEQQSAVAQITEGMYHIESGMHSTTATAEESAASSEQLSALATTLANEVGKFVTE